MIMADAPDGDYLLISIGHEVTGVMVDERSGEIRIPFEGEQSVHVAIGHLELAYEKRGSVIAGEVVRDG
jgi:hypothetical protein